MIIILGMVIGGMVGHFGGVVCGGAIGFLYGCCHALQQHQEVLELELATLRDRVAKPPREPVARGATLRAENVPIVELTEAYLLPTEVCVADPVPPPPEHFTVRGKPVWREYRQTELEGDAAEPPLWLQRLCSGENLLVKLGVLILFIGVSFLVKYVAQRGLFPIELRLAVAPGEDGLATVTGAWIRGCA